MLSRSLFSHLLPLMGLKHIVAAGINSSTTCDAQCQALTLMAAKWETEQLASPNLEFYNIPSNFSADLELGTLLGIEQATNLTNFTVPSGLSMSRIIYTSANLNGTIIPASAYVLWPYESLTHAGSETKEFPLVAWAHGTAGFFKTCAPSN